MPSLFAELKMAQKFSTEYVLLGRLGHTLTTLEMSLGQIM